MILIALGANMPSPSHGAPRATLEAALARLAREGVRIIKRSPWYESAPVPADGGDPWYVNGVAEVETDLDPEALLALLHRVEADFGRVRKARNEARSLDLDLLAYDGRVRDEPPILPHPRMQDRAFVLLPLRDLVPGWVHPRLGLGLGDLIARLPEGQQIRPLEGRAGSLASP